MINEALSRRTAIQWLAVGTGSALGPVRAALGLGGAIASSAVLAPVVSFHLDRPYLDPTGTALPYRPGRGPAGAKQELAGREEHWRSRQLFFEAGTDGGDPRG